MGHCRRIILSEALGVAQAPDAPPLTEASLKLEVAAAKRLQAAVPALAGRLAQACGMGLAVDADALEQWAGDAAVQVSDLLQSYTLPRWALTLFGRFWLAERAAIQLEAVPGLDPQMPGYIAVRIGQYLAFARRMDTFDFDGALALVEQALKGE